jgi:hypothetical protein
MVRPIFHAGEVWGRHQIRGNARGPIEHTAKMIKELQKYHGCSQTKITVISTMKNKDFAMLFSTQKNNNYCH